MFRSNEMASTLTSIFFAPTSSFYTFLSFKTSLKVCIYFLKTFSFGKIFVVSICNTFPLKSNLIHKNMQSIEDYARPMRMADEEEAVLGTTDESKAPNAKSPMVGPSTSKRKRPKQNADEQEEDAPKKKKGGRQPFTNSARCISRDNYNTVQGESATENRRRLQKIQHHLVRKWFNYKMIHPRFKT